MARTRPPYAPEFRQQMGMGPEVIGTRISGFACPFHPLVVVLEVAATERPGCLHAPEHRIVRAQSHGHIQLRDTVRRPAAPVQGKSETVVAVGETRIEGDGFFQFGDGAVALARQTEHPAERVMGEAVLVVQGDRLFAGREPLSQPFGGIVAKAMKHFQEAGVRDTRMRQREIGIASDRLMEQVARLFIALLCVLVEIP